MKGTWRRRRGREKKARWRTGSREQHKQKENRGTKGQMRERGIGRLTIKSKRQKVDSS